jgi:hypothetical protein
MRIKARPHLHYAPVPEGAYLGGATTQVVLSGSPLLFRVVDVCVPLLEDGATEDELVRALGSERARPAVRYLVNTLGSSGLLLDPSRFTVPEPSAEIRARYPETLAHLELVSDDPYAALARLTAATVLLLGPPEVLRPAVRGLRRTGVGRVLTTPDPDGAAADAVLVCGRAADDPTLTAALLRELPWLPAGVPVVPVVLGNGLALAGPALRDASELSAWAELVRRTGSWVGEQVLDPAPHPVADALTGALATRLIVDLLAGTGASGTAHIVHGHQLTSEQVVVHTLPPAPATAQALGDAPTEPSPGHAPIYDDLATLWPRWSGLIEPVSGDDLPQLPLSLRQVRHHGPTAGVVVGWSGDQQGATVSAALEALRRLAPSGGVTAAGPNELLWLLDGALRLLASTAQPVADGPEDLLEDPDTQRIRNALQRADAKPAVRLLEVPGVDWVLASAELPDGETALAWAPCAARAVRDALGTALTRLQTSAITGDPQAVGGLCTDALLLLDIGSVCALRRQVQTQAGAAGLTYAGFREQPDLLLGDLPFWSGTVRAYPRSPEARDDQHQ